MYFELNGQPREIEVTDLQIDVTTNKTPKADLSNPNHIAATMPGTVLKVLVSAGSRVKRGEHLLITEAMKMETTVQAPKDGVIQSVHVENSDGLSVGDLLLTFED